MRPSPPPREGLSNFEEGCRELGHTPTPIQRSTERCCTRMMKDPAPSRASRGSRAETGHRHEVGHATGLGALVKGPETHSSFSKVAQSQPRAECSHPAASSR